MTIQDMRVHPSSRVTIAPILAEPNFSLTYVPLHHVGVES
jgi:hypothetical protein